MKKRKRPLTVRLETVRPLTVEQLQLVDGGTVIGQDPNGTSYMGCSRTRPC